MRLSFLSLLLLISFGLQSQSSIERVEPANWWTDMHNPEVQLLVYGKNIGDLLPKTTHPGINIERVSRVSNPNYLFVDLKITAAAKAGDVVLSFTKNGKEVLQQEWQLLDRNQDPAMRKGFDNADVLYLITPDRFANGNPDNDNIAGMRETANRSTLGGRHGGDIAGMRQHLDYIHDLGFTAIWVNPLLENDMEAYSYHGYSTTDFYRVDPRFGTNEEYQLLANESREKGVKVIMDMIVNHCGLEHWWMKDLPSEDWINTWDEYTQTNHRKTVWQDPYASAIDKKVFADGWFVPTMPDLNQRNPFMATYLIQNSIWWTEYLGLAGIRMDTYPYPDEDFMAEWTRRVMEEFPYLNIVGEEWFENPSTVAYWQAGKDNPNGYTSYLPSLMDFPLQQAFIKALNEEEAFKSGWITAYEMLAQDFLYADPMNLVIFPDNHDMSRIFRQVNEDEDLFRMAMVYFATTRGIPQIYYGTEILMSNAPAGDHGDIRSDFPGGWAGDPVNAFTGDGLTSAQVAAQDFTKTLLRWRKSAEAVHYGKMTHFLPEDGTYVYFRYNDEQKVMVAFNKNDEGTSLDLERFAEMLEGVTIGKDILTGQPHTLDKQLQIPARGVMILELD
ncbi:glycoside hydrolase family 13 protein [Lewinella cohaerens]|uniref:glycoside hydrolase family 13 protein n=1 Tax=Lewinella cohaerens TaxID=70995 RepID=UPI0003637DCA|nr:glycoside hydrolase family 13 protein [Lewinella cohaerens]